AAQASARTNLGLGNSATLNTGTAAGTVAAGNDSRITGATQKASNLSDLANAATARSNLGLGTAATATVGTGANQLPSMASFTSGSGWVKFPDGTIIQRGTSISGPIGYPLAIPLPIAFTNSFTVTTSFDTASNIATDCPSFSVTPIGLAGFYLSSSRPSSSGTGAGANWIAIGK
ncbi:MULTISPECIES: gp53-like domain-containing protein, partial [Rahnella]|uniref:gp53-like domain-containing protein n=1 Tax=Rahnella TaxID=34037 RepID=UPI003F6DC1ED